MEVNAQRGSLEDIANTVEGVYRLAFPVTESYFGPFPYPLLQPPFSHWKQGLSHWFLGPLRGFPGPCRGLNRKISSHSQGSTGKSRTSSRGYAKEIFRSYPVNGRKISCTAGKQGRAGLDFCIRMGYTGNRFREPGKGETMITMAEALTENEFHEEHEPGGKIYRWRRNGKTQTWKTRPGDFRIPVKFGLRNYGQINQDSALVFHPASSCPDTRT